MIKKEELIISKSPLTKNATIYTNCDNSIKACLLYFHGGGLLYGCRDDLPKYHLMRLTEEGYAVIAFDYPLAPNFMLPEILEDVIESINHYISNSHQYVSHNCPFYLWGRSSGAYLILLAATSRKLIEAPNGIISFYGYGLLTDNWIDIPSPYYNTFPAVSSHIIDNISHDARLSSPAEEGFPIYVYARQSGKWPKFFYNDRIKYLYSMYSLRTCSKLPAPLFCAHSIGDTDVPYSEFTELCNKFSASKFIAPGQIHDFDRMESSNVTKNLFDSVISFLNLHTP